MSLDLLLLRLLKHKDAYEKFYRSIPERVVEDSTRLILKDYGRFFEENPSATVAMPEHFLPYFLLLHSRVPKARLDVFKVQISNAEQDVPAAVSNGMYQRLLDSRLARDMDDMIQRYQAGEEVSLSDFVRTTADAIPLSTDDIPFESSDIGHLIEMDASDAGFHWRLSCLNESMRPLRGGDLGIVGARVDKGKTTFLASELTNFARQVDSVYPNEDRDILYINNEGPSARVIQRMYQAALGITNTDMVSMYKAGTLQSAYVEALGGRDNIKVLNAHDVSMSRLKDYIARSNPALIVVDMLDVVPFDGKIMNGGDRTDQVLEAAYQEARIWAVKYNAPVIVTSQLNAEAEGEKYPKLSHLANSRTGKPGAADWICLIGASDDPMLAGERWINLVKNKLHRDGGRKDPMASVIFSGPTARFHDPVSV